MYTSRTRRSILKGTMALPIGAVRGTEANSAITVGLIGCGGRGSFDAGLLVRFTDARLIALCDLYDDRIEKATAKIPVKGAKIYKDYHELLASDVDAVIIATPVFLHPAHFEDAVKAGKHIYIEKPAGLDVAGCRRVLKASESATPKQNIVFGFQQRYGSVYLNAKRALDSGDIGAIRLAHSHWIKGEFTGYEKPTPRPVTEEEKIRQWRLWRATFGDIIVETYVHGIDVLNWFIGSHPQTAYGTGGRTAERRGDIMDHCDLTFTYPGGVQATLTGAQLTPLGFRSVNETFYGSKTVVETAREYWKHYRAKGDTVNENSPREITADAMADFVKRIEEDNPHNTAPQAVESTLTAILGQMAVDKKREIKWEEMLSS
jgi:myo-inositol 2-dehydrogenase / D-chiro-inositol 1-dehydrogenase